MYNVFNVAGMEKAEEDEKHLQEILTAQVYTVPEMGGGVTCTKFLWISAKPTFRVFGKNTILKKLI